MSEQREFLKRLVTLLDEAQIQDILGVLQVQHGRLDQENLRRWANELGVAEKLGELLETARRGIE